MEQCVLKESIALKATASGSLLKFSDKMEIGVHGVNLVHALALVEQVLGTEQGAVTTLTQLMEVVRVWVQAIS